MTFAGQDGARLGGEVFHAKEALNKSTSDQRRANPPTPIRQWGFGE